MPNRILYTSVNYNENCYAIKRYMVFFMFLLVLSGELLYSIYIWTGKEGSKDEKIHIFAIRSDLVALLVSRVRGTPDN